MSAASAPPQHFRQLERMYGAAPVNETIPSRLEVHQAKAEVYMSVGRQLWHSAHALHGSMYFKGLDDAAFFAAASIVQTHFVLTVRFEIELLDIVRCQQLRAVGRVERREGRKIWAHSELFDDADKLVARGKGLFLISDIALTSADGYGDATD